MVASVSIFPAEKTTVLPPLAPASSTTTPAEAAPTPASSSNAVPTSGDTLTLSELAKVRLLNQQGKLPADIRDTLQIDLATIDNDLGLTADTPPVVPATPPTSVANTKADTPGAPATDVAKSVTASDETPADETTASPTGVLPARKGGLPAPASSLSPEPLVSLHA